MYDIIVIGNDLASLMAAVCSARSGMKTILLNDMDIPDFYEASGYTFDIDPFPWTGFEPGGILSGILADLDIPADTVPIDPPLQFIFRDHRIDVLSDIPSQIKEIERELDGNAVNLRSLYRTIEKTDVLISELLRDNPQVRPQTAGELLAYLCKVPAMVRLKSVFSRQLSRMQPRSPLKRALTAELLLFSHLNPDGIAPLSLAYSLARPFRRLFYPLGGKYRIIDALKRKIESMGGMVKRCSTVHLDINDEVVVDIAGNNGESFVIKGKTVILSTQWQGFLPFMLGDRRCSAIAEQFTDIEASHYPFSLHLGIAEASIPERLSQYSVLISDTLPRDATDIFREGFLFFELSATGDSACAPRRRRALTVTAFLKESPADMSNKELTDVSVRMMKGTETLFPFLAESIDFIDIDSSISLSRKYQGAINQRYSLKNNPMLGVSLLAGKTPLPNLSIAGGTLLAGLGMEGEIISGLNALHIVNEGGKDVHNQETG